MVRLGEVTAGLGQGEEAAWGTTSYSLESTNDLPGSAKNNDSSPKTWPLHQISPQYSETDGTIREDCGGWGGPFFSFHDGRGQTAKPTIELSDVGLGVMHTGKTSWWRGD